MAMDNIVKTGVFLEDAKPLARVAVSAARQICLKRYAVFADGKVKILEMPEIGLSSDKIAVYKSSTNELILKDFGVMSRSQDGLEDLKKSLRLFIQFMSSKLKDLEKPFFISFISAFDEIFFDPPSAEKFLEASFENMKNHYVDVTDWPYDSLDMAEIAKRPFTLSQFKRLLDCLEAGTSSGMEHDMLKIESRKIVAVEIESRVSRFHSLFPEAMTLNGRLASTCACEVCFAVASQDWAKVEKLLTNFYTKNHIENKQGHDKLVKKFFDLEETRRLKEIVSSYSKQQKLLGLPDIFLMLADYKNVCETLKL